MDWTDELGAVVTDGEWLFVGAPKDDQLQTNAGAVHVFRLVNGTWIFQEKLFAAGGVGPAEFGTTIAVDGDAAIIGAPRDRELSDLYDPGAAYVLRRENENWVQTQKLLSFGPGLVHRFGHAVGLQNGVAIVGCISVDNDVITSKGAAFVFHDVNGKYVAA